MPPRRDREHVREFFTERAARWESRFPDDTPVFAQAVAELGLREGDAVLDAGCGTGRALPLLREAVGSDGRVLGCDLTPAMLEQAVTTGRQRFGHLLLADAARLPLPAGSLDAVFAAGLVGHLPDPAACLTEFARTVRPGGVLALFHPVGRAVLAARRKHPLTPDDVRAEPRLRPLLSRSGWDLTSYTDEDARYLVLATRR